MLSQSQAAYAIHFPESQKPQKLVITNRAGIACAQQHNPRDWGLLVWKGVGAWEGCPGERGGLRGLIPAGLGMMGVPGGPPPPGGPCGDKAGVGCANMSTAHLSLFSNTSPNSHLPWH